MKGKYHSQFLLDKEKDSNSAKIRYRIKWQKNIVAFNLGYRVDIDKWSTDTQRCKINTTHGKKKIPANIINRKIQEYESVCEKLFNNNDLNNLSAAEFRNLFNSEIGKTSKDNTKKTFFEIFDDFVNDESRANHWTDSTISKMNTLKNHLINFNPNIDFDFLNENGLIEFQIFLQDDLGFKNSTTLKQFSFLKWFLRWATKKQFNNNNAFTLYRPKLKSTQKKIIFLTQEELKILTEFEIPTNKKYLERVRDVFLFQCYSGLRYSDVANLTRNDVKENYIEITTVKTADNLIIELNNHSKRILDKYKDETFENNLVLPVITNQKMNEYLKELGELAELNEPIRETYFIGNKRIDEVNPKYSLLGTHAGRRTFICNALSLGIPPQVVMKWTGHSDYASMKPYIDIADEIKANAMEKFNSLLSP